MLAAASRALKESALVLLAFLAHTLPPTHAKGGGGGGGGGGWGGGGGSSAGKSASVKAGGSSRPTTTGGTSSSNSWSIGGPSTKRGSSLYKPATGNYRSGRPGYYGAGHSQAGTYAASQGMSFTRKAIMWSAVAVAGLYFYSSLSAAQRKTLNPPVCPRGQFRFGRECRVCSEFECPIGQYRMTCTPDTDSYCAPCTNTKSSATAVYLTPGNNNDCQFGEPMSNANDLALTDSEPVDLALVLEMPLTKEKWLNQGEKVKRALTEAAGLPSGTDLVKVGTVTEFDMKDVNKNLCEKPEDVSSSDWKEPTFCYTAEPLPSDYFTDTKGDSNYCKDMCGVDESDDYCKLTTAASKESSQYKSKCGWSTQNECCPRGRRAEAESDGFGAETQEIQGSGPSRRLLNANSSNSSSNSSTSQTLSNSSSAAATTTTTTTTTTPSPTPSPQSCAIDLDDGGVAGKEKFVVFEATVRTTVGKMDATWDKLNEFNINKAFQQKCLPPVVVSYEAVGSAAGLRSRLMLALVSSALTLLLAR